MPLKDPVRQDMEARFGRDFEDVRVHTGTSAARSAADIAAQAYTVASDIVLRGSAHDFETASGLRLLAHELAHVEQWERRGIERPVILRQPAPGSGGPMVVEGLTFAIGEGQGSTQAEPITVEGLTIELRDRHRKWPWTVEFDSRLNNTVRPILILVMAHLEKAARDFIDWAMSRGGAAGTKESLYFVKAGLHVLPGVGFAKAAIEMLSLYLDLEIKAERLELKHLAGATRDMVQSVLGSDMVKQPSDYIYSTMPGVYRKMFSPYRAAKKRNQPEPNIEQMVIAMAGVPNPLVDWASRFREAMVRATKARNGQ